MSMAGGVTIAGVSGPAMAVTVPSDCSFPSRRNSVDQRAVCPNHLELAAEIVKGL